jgi:hypothetical protein
MGGYYMKSLHKTKELIKIFFKITIKPRGTIKDFDISDQNPLMSFIIILFSGIIFLTGIFIAGDVIYSIFFEQYSTFILEQLTSGYLFGFWISRYDFVLVFLNSLTFIIKSWLFFSLTFYIFMRLLRERQNFEKLLNMFAWIIYPFSWIFFLFSLICNLLKYIIPLYYHYIFYLGLIGFFLVVVPIFLHIYYNNQDLEKKPNLYKIIWSYFLTIFVIIILWTYNHYDLILLGLI